MGSPARFGITAVNTVALWYKSGVLDQAESVAHRILSRNSIESFAVAQLRSLLQTIWNARAQEAAGVQFVPGQVQISVRGGEVVSGGAPLDLIVENVQTIQSLFYRTAEWLKHLPLRKHGPTTKEIQESCRPWLFQRVPASYQFVVAIQSPPQADWISPETTDPQLVADTFLAILKSAVDDSGQGLSKIVPDRGYKTAFF
jgi:hypothetical protein